MKTCDSNAERRPVPPGALAVVFSAGLGDDNIKNTIMRLEESNDCSWTELCILTTREIAGAYREWIAHHIYESSCEMGGARAWKWSDIPETQKEQWRKRADEAVKRQSPND